MVRPFYEGASLHVRAYDSLHEPPPAAIAGDVAFYERHAQEAGGPVLEVGVGTGRVGLALERPPACPSPASTRRRRCSPSRERRPPPWV